MLQEIGNYLPLQPRMDKDMFISIMTSKNQSVWNALGKLSDKTFCVLIKDLNWIELVFAKILEHLMYNRSIELLNKAIFQQRPVWFPE